MPFFQIGIWRSSSGVREAGCSIASVSRTRRVGRVDLVEEQEARNAGLLELAQDRPAGPAACARPPRNDDRRVAGGRDASHLVQEFDGAGAIDEGHALAHEVGGGDVRLDAMAVGARLGAAVADGVAVGDPAGALDGARSLQDGFEQRGLAALKGPDDGDAPWTRETSTCGFLLRARLPMVSSWSGHWPCKFRRPTVIVTAWSPPKP